MKRIISFISAAVLLIAGLAVVSCEGSQKQDGSVSRIVLLLIRCIQFTFQYPLLSEPIRSIKPLSFNFKRILLIVRCEIPSFVIKCLMVKSPFSCNADNSFSENFTLAFTLPLTLPFTLPFLSLLL